MTAARGRVMATSKIKLRLNQQQIELIDNTIRAGESNSRDDLVRRALREFAKANLPKPEKTTNDVD
jgi:Arc/MetJ-type ribon-helix-helix transcriptional regulator